MASIDNHVQVKLAFKASRVYGVRMWIARMLMKLACRIATGHIGDVEIK